MVVYGWVKRALVDWQSVKSRHAVRVPIRTLRELLRNEDYADGTTKARFEAWAEGKWRDVRFEADTLIASEMKHGFVPDYNHLNLYGIQSEAKSLEKDSPGDAETVYMDLTESLGVHYQIIDDSSGEFWPLFEECIEAVGRCIKAQNLSKDDLKWRIEYLAHWSVSVFTDFMEYYEKVLNELCTSAEDLNVWKKALEDELKSEDINNRNCHWAADKAGIERALKRVLRRTAEIGMKQA